MSGTGLVTAIASGSANILATSEGKSGSAPLTVVPVPVASLTLSAPTTQVVLGQAQQLTDSGGGLIQTASGHSASLDGTIALLHSLGHVEPLDAERLKAVTKPACPAGGRAAVPSDVDGHASGQVWQTD